MSVDRVVVALTCSEHAPRPQLLVLRALGLGDFLTGVPALRALVARFPEHRRVLACPVSLRPLVRLTGGFEVLDVDGLQPHPPVGPVSVAVNLHGRGPTSHRRLLETQPDHLVAFRHPAIATSSDAPRWRAGEHEVTRWCRMLSQHGIAADPSDLDLAPSRRSIESVPSLTVVHPGAASAARRWPVKRFAAVARDEVAAGRRVVVTGDASERALGERLATLAGLPADAVLAGSTSLSDLVALVRRAGTVVCGDTGIAHLATALRRPSVVLFGPTAPAEWGPPVDRHWHRVLWAGRTGDPHADATDRGLLEISVADVREELRLLRRDAPADPTRDQRRRRRATPTSSSARRTRPSAWAS